MKLLIYTKGRSFNLQVKRIAMLMDKDNQIPAWRKLYITFDDEHAGLENILNYFFEPSICTEVYKYDNGTTTIVVDTDKVNAMVLVKKQDNISVALGTNEWLAQQGTIQAQEIMNSELELKPISEEFELMDMPICGSCTTLSCKQCPML